MTVIYKTKVNTNGNSYALIVDYDSKRFRKGFGIASYADFKATKNEISEHVKDLKLHGFTEDNY